MSDIRALSNSELLDIRDRLEGEFADAVRSYDEEWERRQYSDPRDDHFVKVLRRDFPPADYGDSIGVRSMYE